jgi:hypothetical protein
MMEIVKKVKNGQEIKFICSTCGDVIYSVFVLTGDICEIDWDKLPEKCSCGAKLTRRQPIIDADNLDFDIISKDISEGLSGIVHENNLERDVTRCREEKADVYKRYIMDFENAISVDYFDMRLNGLKSGNFKVPDNIDNLRIECLNRNISYIELCMRKLSYLDDNCDKDELKEKLKRLKQRYNDMSRKSEDKKDLARKDLGSKDLESKDLESKDLESKDFNRNGRKRF